jgi:hypothetical protein
MVAIVQVSPVASDFNDDLTITFGAAVGNGNSVALHWVSNEALTVDACNDNQSNSYTEDELYSALTGNGQELRFYSRHNITNGPTSINPDMSAGGSIRGLAIELSGVNTTTPFGTSGSNDGNSSTATLSLTTPSDNECIIVFIETGAASTVTEGSYTQVPWDGSEPSFVHTLYLADAGSAGVKNLSFAFGGSVQWAIRAVTYRNAGGGGASGNPWYYYAQQ